MFALIAAIVYNFVWLGTLSDLFWMYFGEQKTDFDDPDGVIEVFSELVMAYSLIIGIPNIVVNCVIIIKEISLPLIQWFLNRKAPTEADRLQLGLIDLEYLFLRYLNPAWLLQQLFKDVAGYDPVDMVVENKNDEQHYYAGSVVRKFQGK